MTTAVPRRRPAPVDLDAALERIRASGGRVTAAKRAVAALLYASSVHRTADDIADDLPGVDRSVVYRCLGQFEDLGIAEHVHLGHGRAVYRRAGLGTVPVACVGCGAAFELDIAETEAFRRLVADRTGIDLDLVHVALSGWCRACRASDGS